MIILSIETSCDDTAVAVLEKKKGQIKTLASVVSSQDKIHQKWGGIYPSKAKREHQKNLVPALKKTLKEANLLEKGKTSAPPSLKEVLYREKTLLETLEDFFFKHKVSKKIDALAVTIGPGLEPCLWVGINFARSLSLSLDIPIIPVNHVKAHLFSSLLENKNIDFPAVGLVVSGGHTELVLLKSFSSLKLIGKTRDDAAGECFDKTARILGLGYPGGPEISAKAKKFTTKNSNLQIALPRPMINSKNYDFSFSGLKTAVLYDFLSRDKKTRENKDYIAEMSKEIEEAITTVLSLKLKKAAKNYEAKTIILGGGVTANKTLREKVERIKKDLDNLKIFIPPVNLSTDNAEIIGATAFLKKTQKPTKDLSAKANLKIYDTI